MPLELLGGNAFFFVAFPSHSDHRCYCVSPPSCFVSESLFSQMQGTLRVVVPRTTGRRGRMKRANNANRAKPVGVVNAQHAGSHPQKSQRTEEGRNHHHNQKSAPLCPCSPPPTTQPATQSVQSWPAKTAPGDTRSASLLERWKNRIYICSFC